MSERPKTRGECANVPRPCPWTTCRYHLEPDRRRGPSPGHRSAALKVIDERESCALDVADRGGETLENVGALLGLTRERVRQIEVAASRSLRIRVEQRLGHVARPNVFQLTGAERSRLRKLRDEGVPVKDIAAMLGTSTGTVYTRLRRMAG